MGSEEQPSLLNESQRRAVSASLRRVERAVEGIERVLLAPVAGITFCLADELAPEERRAIHMACDRVRADLRMACRRLEIESAEGSRRAEIRGEVAALWAMLEDTKSPALRGYGPLSQEAGAVVDEVLEEISEELQGILRVVADGRPVRSGAVRPSRRV